MRIRAEGDRRGNRARDRRDAALASRGDTAAFSRLVEAHSALVRGIARGVLGADDARDASQEVWIRVWCNVANFRGESAFTTWLYRIATNTCLDLYRGRMRREEHQHGGEMPYLAETAGDADPEASVLNAERRMEIGTALEHVRTEHRAALVLRHMQGLSYAEIAEALDVPNGTAKGWASRGRAALLVALSDDVMVQGEARVHL